MTSPARTPSKPNSSLEPLREFSTPTAAGIAIAVLVMHIITNFITPYGFHRDEFLYLAMGEHLRLWQMDFPPFIALVGRVSHALFGTSLAGIRLGPAFAHAGLVYAATLATALFGGRRSAQMLAALTVALGGNFLRAGAMLQPVVFDQLWWTLALLALTIRIKENDPKHWLGIGLFLGLAALTKFSVAFIAAGFVVALLVTALRKDLTTKWPWLALVIATVVGHPSITGQVLLNWPVFQQFADLQKDQLSHVSPLSFITDQLPAGPVFFLALGGMVWLFISGRRVARSMGSESPRGDWGQSRAEQIGVRVEANKLGSESHNDTTRSMGSESPKNGTIAEADFRPVAVATATAFFILLALRGKAYYIAPIYPILIAAGAAGIDEFSVRLSPKRPTKVLAVVAAIVALYGMIGLPFGLPVLAPVEISAVSQQLGQTHRTNQGEEIPLPQDFADMLGWEDLATKTARVWRELPPADTANAIILGTNYGRAGALDLLGREQGLPPAISPAGSYWFFGPGTKRGDVAVVPAQNADELQKFYSECTEKARTNNPWGVPEEQSVRIYVCRGAKSAIQDLWPSLAGRN